MPLEIVVVGAGIGGPAFAIDAARNGHLVTLYESSTLTQEVGFAFRLTPNSSRCLQHLAIDAEAGGACVASNGHHFTSQGVPIELGEKENQDGRAAKSLYALRPQLNAQLMRRCQELGVQLDIGVNVDAVDVETTTLRLSTGNSVSADLIVGADGINSTVRNAISGIGEKPRLKSSGQNALRFMLSRSQVLKDPLIASVVNEDAPFYSWMEAEKLILFYTADFGKQFNLVCTFPESLSDEDDSNDGENTYNQKISQEAALEIYQGFAPAARRLIELADPEGFRVWKLVDMDESNKWFERRVALIGDACHPLLPFGFSAASMSIEDAVTLSAMLPRDVKPDDIPGRLKLYQNTRIPRVGRVRDASRKIGNRKDQIEPTFFKDYMQFLTSIDVVKHAQETLADEMHGAKGGLKLS